MQIIKVGKRYIGHNQPCFITVDVGANHNRSLLIAKKLIDYAADSNADAIKMQVYSAETLYSKNVPKHSYYKKHLWELIKEIEMPRAWIPKLKEYCDKKNIIFFATPFDMQAVEQLNPYVDFYKIASFELVDIPLIQKVAQKKKPIIISTGLATIPEIKDAFNACVAAGNKKIIFLHCVSAYPSDPHIMNLNAMRTIARTFNVPVGLSDHSLGIHISIAAVAMGACFIERHFTLDKTMKGPDHPFALEPAELKEMVKQIREVESAFGDGKKKGPRKQELENFNIGRRSIHSCATIPKGTVITDAMIIVKRPGYGIKPKYVHEIIGRKARRTIKQDSWIRWKDV